MHSFLPKKQMSLPRQLGRDNDRRSFVFKHVIIDVIDNKDKIYIIKP